MHIMEAMTAGLPIISTKCRGASELVEDGKNGYTVRIGDTYTFTNKIKDIVCDEEKRKKMAKDSKKRSVSYKLAAIKTIMAKIYGEQ